jgi:spermidine synthase
VKTASSVTPPRDPAPVDLAPSSSAAPAPTPTFVAALLFGSGLCALVYQTAWQRLFQLVFGASAAASSAVLAVFLGGLGAGALYFGPRVMRTPRPLAFYGTLELAVAVIAAASPFLLDALTWVYLASGGSMALGTGGASVLRLVIATLVMGAPAFLMGGTLPAAARAVETERDLARTRVALLYGINTLGAVLGALLGTFFLFETFGTRSALWIAALSNLLVAVAARARGREAPPMPAEPKVEAEPTRPPEPSSDAVPLRQRQRWQPRVAAGTALVSGFGFLLLELIWYRMLAPVLGGSTFTFGLILALVLGGIGLGGYAYSRRVEDAPPTLAGLASTTALLALMVSAPFAAGDTIAVYSALTRDLGGWGFLSLVASWASIAGLIVFPAALVSGYQFPLLFALLGRGRERVATDLGHLYGANTLGSIAGALLGGFVLIPTLGAVFSWQLAGALFAVTALATLVVSLASERRHWALAGWTLALASAALVASSARGPTAAFRHAPIGAGRARLSGLDRNELLAWRNWHNASFLWERDGVESAVGVAATNGYTFSINGKVDGSVFADRGTQAMSGLLPALLIDQARTAFVVGLGTGMTAGWLSQIPGMERVDVAELEPAIGEVARMAAAANHDVMNRPNVFVHFGDGREHLLTSDGRYDLILSEPSNPYRSGIASLYTEEFYSVVRSRLGPGGLFGQWVQDYEIDARSLRSIAHTLTRVFGAVELWQTESGDLLFIGSEAALTHDVARLRGRIATEPFKSALPRLWLVEDVEGVLSHFVAGPRVVEQMAMHLDPPLNTDDQNFLEYAFARSVGVQTKSAVPRLRAYTRAISESLPRLVGEVDFERVRELMPRSSLISSPQVPPTDLPAAARARFEAVAAGCSGNPAAVLVRWEAQPRQEPSDDIERFALAVGHGWRGRATSFIAELDQRGYVAEAHLARGLAALKGGDPAGAVAEYARGIATLRTGPIPLCSTATDLVAGLREAAAPSPELTRRALSELMAGPLMAGLAEDDRRRAIELLAFSLMRVPGTDPGLCLTALAERVQQPLWNRAHLEGRLECLRRSGHELTPDAEDDLISFLAASTGELVPEPPPDSVVSRTDPGAVRAERAAAAQP